jgi:uncharacterized protein DUF3631
VLGVALQFGAVGAVLLTVVVPATIAAIQGLAHCSVPFCFCSAIHWGKRARVAAVALVADSNAGPPSMNIRLLMDLRDIFGEEDRMTSDDILRQLIKIETPPGVT